MNFEFIYSMATNKGKSPIYVILDNIRSALNVGSIFRTCDAVNVEVLYLCGITAYPPHNKLPKTSLGAIDYVQWKHFSTTRGAVKSLPQGTSIISVELTSTAVDFWRVTYKQPLALIFGNEITGISEEILKLASKTVKIPMFGKKESLNVATSCGIVLYEVTRQWRRDRK